MTAGSDDEVKVLNMVKSSVFISTTSLETLSLEILVEMELSLQYHNVEKSASVKIHTLPPI